MTEIAEGTTRAYQRISEIPDPSIPLVKYPRTPGYKPTPEDNPYNAWAWRCDIKGAPTGKLAGKTVAIKDNIAVAGVPMRNGTKILDGYVPEFDATLVSRILDEGGRILGKSGVEDMCLSGSSVTNSDGPVRNPHDETRITGGSSSGSGALVCGGQVDLAIGGDQGGSIRIPASFTGIVGLKPTWGLVPYTGASNIEPTVDHLGPMARTVTDCALLLEVIAGDDDGRDPRQKTDVVIPEYTKLLEQGVSGKKVGLLTEGFEACTEEAVKTVVRAAANKLTQVGAIVKETSIPMHKDAGAIWTVTGGQGAYKCMYESNGTGFFAKGFYPTSLQEATFRGRTTHPQDMQPIFKFFCLYMSHIDRMYGNKFYAKGQNLILELTKKYDAALQEFDVLIMPTMPYTASKMPAKDCSFKELHLNAMSMVANTMPYNSTGHPALSINAGFSPPDGQDKRKLPIGMMIVGRKFDEVTVLQFARAFEKLSG
ncbi:hypothetical protein V1264_019296 [Littorina saxatilis]